MRLNEITTGVDLYTPDDLKHENPVGKSAKAGRLAVAKTITSRIMTAAPLLLLPPFMTALYRKTALAKSTPVTVQVFNVTCVGVCLLVFLPLCLATFPQYCSIPASDLDPKFQNLKEKNGNAVNTLIYNKGL